MTLSLSSSRRTDIENIATAPSAAADLASLDLHQLLLAANVLIQQIFQLPLHLLIFLDQWVQCSGVMYYAYSHHLTWKELLKLPFCDLKQCTTGSGWKLTQPHDQRLSATWCNDVLNYAYPQYLTGKYLLNLPFSDLQ